MEHPLMMFHPLLRFIYSFAMQYWSLRRLFNDGVEVEHAPRVQEDRGSNRCRAQFSNKFKIP